MDLNFFANRGEKGTTCSAISNLQTWFIDDVYKSFSKKKDINIKLFL